MEPLIGLNQKALAGETSGDQLGPPLPTTSSEKVNAVRGEMGRMTGW